MVLRTITSPVMQRCGVDEAQRGGVDEAHSDLVAGTEIEHSEVQLEYRPVCDQPMDDEMHHVPPGNKNASVSCSYSLV